MFVARCICVCVCVIVYVYVCAVFVCVVLKVFVFYRVNMYPSAQEGCLIMHCS